MSLVRVFTPQTLSEATVVVALLEAHEIPVLRHNGLLAGLLPGVQVNAYNTQSIMVPEEHAADALELLAQFHQRPEVAAAPRSILRMIFETLFFAWFVPGSRPSRAAPVPAKFLELHDVDEARHATVATPSFAVVIARAPGGVVLVFNRYRKVWELPGGLIDPGETPRDAAARELAEESGCISPADGLVWLGLVSVEDGSTHHGAVYRTEVEFVAKEFRSEETGGIAFWQAGVHPQPLGATDRALLQRFG